MVLVKRLVMARVRWVPTVGLWAGVVVLAAGCASENSRRHESLFCEVSAESAATRQLPEGAFLDAGDSGCDPSERRICISDQDGPVLAVEWCTEP